MPAVLRQSGPKFKREGVEVTPRALIKFCEKCGFEGAMFGDTVDGKRRFWCGWANGQPYCKGKENGTNERSRNDGGGALHRDQSESPNLFV